MNLDERMRRASTALLEQVDAVDRDRLYARIATRPRRRWVLAAVAVATAAAAVATVVVVPRLLDRGVIIDQPPFADTSPSPGGDGAGVPTGTWRRVPDPQGLFGGPGEQVITGLAVTNGVAVAVGGDGEHGDQAAIWRAAQLDRWERVAVDLCGEASCTIGDVTTVAEAFVAVGQVDGLPKAWTSEDGAVWTRIDLPVPTGGRPAVSPLTALEEVVSSGDGAVVVLGSIDADGGVQPVAYRADGLDGEWQQGGLGPTFDGELPITFDALTRFAGRYVAIAHAGDGLGFAHSDDGLTWELTPPTPGVYQPNPNRPTALVIDGERLLALGTVHGKDEVDGAVWASDDGVNWQRVHADGIGGPGQQAVLGAGVVDGAIVAVGEHFPGGTEPTHPAAWQRRADGAWLRLDGDGTFDSPGRLTTTAQLDGHSLLVAGRIVTDDRPDVALWTYTLDGDGSDARQQARPDDADCSAAVMPADLPPDAGLPPAADDLREALYEAAVACDYGRLEVLATRGERPFTFSLGAGEDDSPAAYWQMLEQRDEPGERPLWYLAQLLRLPHGQKVETQLQADRYSALIVWPRAFASDQPTDAEYQELVDAGLYGGGDIAAFRQFGGYAGWRVGITPDGEWIFFVAGD